MRKPTQLGPFADVHPLPEISRSFEVDHQNLTYGYGGLPKGLEALGCVPFTSKPVWVYESPLTWSVYSMTKVLSAYKTKSCLTFFHPNQDVSWKGAAIVKGASDKARTTGLNMMNVIGRSNRLKLTRLIQEDLKFLGDTMNLLSRAFEMMQVPV